MTMAVPENNDASTKYGPKIVEFHPGLKVIPKIHDKMELTIIDTGISRRANVSDE